MRKIPYGDGKAADRIMDAIATILTKEHNQNSVDFTQKAPFLWSFLDHYLLK